MESKTKPTFMEKLAAFIVDKRSIVFFICIGACLFCIIASGWVSVNNNITSYLPANTETRKGLTIMDDEFKTFATARVMVTPITYQKAEAMASELAALDGVYSVDFDASEEHFIAASALFEVTFEGEAAEETSAAAMEKIKEKTSGYHAFISSEVGQSLSDMIASEMVVVFLIAVVIIVGVLLFTSKTYLEVPVLLLTFAAAALLNMGTNYWFGTISFVTNSVAVVLQLALGIDYAIIMCHRFTEERETKQPREAAIAALSKAIPEISASCLTTISGLVAMMFMQFRIGYDMGIVLVKAIIFSLLSVFLLMPGLLVLFSKGIDKTHHKNFVPKINLWGKAVVKTRYVMPALFLILLVAAFVFSNRCPYVYGYSTLTTPKQNESQIAETRISETFGRTNIMALVFPTGNYEAEKALLGDLQGLDQVDYAMGLSNIETMDGYVLTDKLTPRQFSELLDIDYEVSQLLYAAYATEEGRYSKIVNGLDSYGVPLLDIFDYLYQQADEGYITLDTELQNQLEELHTELQRGELQLKGEHYSRVLISLNLPVESQETFDYLETLRLIAEKHYDESYLVGDSTSNAELADTFSRDNIMISILSALFVILVLIFTFKSVGLPILLIAVIEGAIWINFSFPYVTGSNLFFLSYLIVSSIQMGANIDYAIVISSRYMELKQRMPIHEAIVETLNLAFPTILTSGTILASAGIIIGFMSSECTISSIGLCLGRGTIISMFLVMGVLPQILLLGDIVLEKTAFSVKMPEIARSLSGNVWVSGRVRGYVSGIVDAEMHGFIHGTVNAAVKSGDMGLESEQESEFDEIAIDEHEEAAEDGEE